MKRGSKVEWFALVWCGIIVGATGYYRHWGVWPTMAAGAFLGLLIHVFSRINAPEREIDD